MKSFLFSLKQNLYGVLPNALTPTGGGVAQATKFEVEPELGGTGSASV